MIIQIDGTNTLNKGAELMLVAIIEEIERRHPSAEIVFNTNYGGDLKLDTDINIKLRFCQRYSRVFTAILRRLNLPYLIFTTKYPLKNIDFILDASGFQFSDQWNYSKARLDVLENYYKKNKENGTKIVLLPQAFGPFETENGKQSISIVNKYVDLIIAREKISFQFLFKSGLNKDKIFNYPDFTCLVKGIKPKLKNYKNKVCLIPNKKMITHTSSSKKKYLEFLAYIINIFENQGKEIFLLNHEGNEDYEICLEIKKFLNKGYDIVNDLSAKEIKGIIGESSFVISSRFHGVASALNQSVPCMATSWNHKYEMLFMDFGLGKEMILSIDDDQNKIYEKIILLIKSGDVFKNILKSKLDENKRKTEEMWEKVWSNV